MGELKPPANDVNEISIYPDVHGWGEVDFDKEEELYKPTKSEGNRQSFAIEFTPLYRLKHLPLRLDTSFVIKDQDKKEVLVEGEKEFSVFEVFGAILSEISFCGLPDDRDEKWQDIVDRVEELEDELEEDSEE